MRASIVIVGCIISIFFTLDIYQNLLLFRNVNVFSESSISFDNVKPINIKYINELIKPIPYNINNKISTFKIDPKERYNYSIKNGHGNCSEIVFGASYQLLKDAKEFYILHFYPKDDWKKGAGHSVILVKINSEFVIVDLLEGGIVFNLDQDNLFRNDQAVNFMPLNPLRDSINPYFPKVFDYQVGIIENNSVMDYFQFLNKIYVSIGNDKFEYLIYNGLALFFDQYPIIHIDKKHRLFTNFEIFRFQFYLWWFRFLIVSLFVMFLIRLLIIFRKK